MIIHKIDLADFVEINLRVRTRIAEPETHDAFNTLGQFLESVSTNEDLLVYERKQDGSISR